MGAPVYHFDIAQNTPEWYAVRAGCWSASNAATIMGGLDTKGLEDLIQTLAWERVYGPTDEPGYQSAAMKRGHALEQEARDWTAFNADAAIAQCGFVMHATIPHVGWSPDGLYIPGKKRAAEIKCLLHKAYMSVLFKREVPAEYRWQCRWATWVGDLDELDFVVYHPKPGGLVVKVERDHSFDAQMAERVALLEERVSAMVQKIKERSEAA